MGKKKFDLKTPATRRRLKPYPEPQWEKLPVAMTKATSFGFRQVTPFSLTLSGFNFKKPSSARLIEE
jgi:hypothetical protein